MQSHSLAGMRNLHPFDRAQRDIDLATYAAIVSGISTLVMALLVLMADAATSLATIGSGIDVGLSFGLAYGIARRSRAAAVSALMLLALITASRLAQSGFPSGLLGAVIFGYCYIRGVRGTFAYHSLRQAAHAPTTSSAPAA